MRLFLAGLPVLAYYTYIGCLLSVVSGPWLIPAIILPALPTTWLFVRIAGF